MEGTILALVGLLAALAWAVCEIRAYRAVLRSELPSDAFRRLYRPPATYRGSDTNVFRMNPGYYAVSAMSYAPGAVGHVNDPRMIVPGWPD